MIDTTLPLTDIHRHLDGNIRPQTILELGRQYNISLPAQSLDLMATFVPRPFLNLAASIISRFLHNPWKH